VEVEQRLKCHLVKVEKIAEVVGEEEKGVEVVIVEEVMDDLVEVGVEEDLVATEVIEATEAIEATEEIGEEILEADESEVVVMIGVREGVDVEEAEAHQKHLQLTHGIDHIPETATDYIKADFNTKIMSFFSVYTPRAFKPNFQQ